MKNKIIYYCCLLCCCFSLVTAFSQSQQLPAYLQGKETAKVLLNSSVTQYFGEQVYMDVWERLWIPHGRQLACMDLSADVLDMQFVDLDVAANINDICWLNNGDMIIALDSTLILLDDDGYSEITKLPYPNINIVAAGDSLLYVFGKSATRNKYDVALVDLFGNIQRLFSTNEKITDVAGNGYVTVLVLNKELVLFSPKVEPTVFFTAENKINTIAITDSGGFFVATSDGIYYFENLDNYYMLSKIGAKKLWLRNQKLYILFENGNLSVMPINTEFSVNLKKQNTK